MIAVENLKEKKILSRMNSFSKSFGVGVCKKSTSYTVALFPKHFFREFLKSIFSVKNQCEIKCVDT